MLCLWPTADREERVRLTVHRREDRLDDRKIPRPWRSKSIDVRPFTCAAHELPHRSPQLARWARPQVAQVSCEIFNCSPPRYQRHRHHLQVDLDIAEVLR